MSYYAHTNDQELSHWQTILDHLQGTAQLAYNNGLDAGVADLARTAALLHDIGKYSQAFQRRLAGSGERVDHATAGAKEAVNLFKSSPIQKVLGELLAYCIAGHHGGLPDYGSPADLEVGTLLARLKRKVEDYSAYRKELHPSALAVSERLPVQISPETVGFTLSVLTRMIYSALVDADFQDTETFVNGGKKPRGDYANLQTLTQQFSDYLQQFDNPQTPINRRRSETLQTCITRSSDPPGLFTLTLPTGAGKTLASMAFALNHAVCHGLKRVIYVIPYTSIIEQNAAVFKRSLGIYHDHVLEHHSNFDWNPKEQGERTDYSNHNSALMKLRLAAENWDIPIIVTTSVQFFESFYANRSSRCRKLHNLAKSVIIFDEAQMLPRPYLKPCLYAVTELVRNYGATAVFCTATQPYLDPFIPGGMQITELIPNVKEQFNFYRRVQVVYQGRLSDVDLLAQINQHEQALCVVNTRKHARALYSELPQEGSFHLSTLMCAVHRSQVIGEIRRRLQSGQPCRVISTQLLEAGVDLDFPVGYRALAGLESIIQSAGRVNREGRRPTGTLLVFEPDSEHARKTPLYIRQSADIARRILDKYPDPISIEAVRAYFTEIYQHQAPQNFDSRNILGCFEKHTPAPDFDFQTAAENFKLIGENTVGVIIPFDETAEQYLQELRTSPFPYSVLRKLQPYTVNIYEQEYQALVNSGAIDLYCERFAVLIDPQHYDPHTGLVIPEITGGYGIFFG
ncbi:MAG: CRISPR-associated helicase Cas3' [Chloroflexi bacterium]|nr:CRISPR-associated helicase Cas3' [Chloroflexota bacterium]